MSMRVDAAPLGVGSHRPAHGAKQPFWRTQQARRFARIGAVVGGTLLLLALLAFTVFPTRTWLSQRAATSRAIEHLEVLQEQNRALEARAKALERDEEIERLAREQYNLVRPGEEAYAVLPPPPAELDLPAIWPYGELVAPPAPVGSSDDAPSIPRDE